MINPDWPFLTPAVRDLIDAVAEATPEFRAAIKDQLRDAALATGGNAPVFAAAARSVEAVEIDGDLEHPARRLDHHHGPRASSSRSTRCPT